jgi:Ser/Thr protein kinase RdoA (MazF antagonist)
MMAFEQKGIIHNDSHARNVLLESTKKQTIRYNIGAKDYDVPTRRYRIVIMDFENALVSKDKLSGREFVYKDMGRLVSDLYYESNIRMSKELTDIIDSLTHSNPPFAKAIATLLSAVANSEWYDPPTSTNVANLVYNPDVFG